MGETALAEENLLPAPTGGEFNCIFTKKKQSALREGTTVPAAVSCSVFARGRKGSLLQSSGGLLKRSPPPRLELGHSIRPSTGLMCCPHCSTSGENVHDRRTLKSTFLVYAGPSCSLAPTMFIHVYDRRRGDKEILEVKDQVRRTPFTEQ